MFLSYIAHRDAISIFKLAAWQHVSTVSLLREQKLADRSIIPFSLIASRTVNQGNICALMWWLFCFWNSLAFSLFLSYFVALLQRLCI